MAPETPPQSGRVLTVQSFRLETSLTIFYNGMPCVAFVPTCSDD